MVNDTHQGYAQVRATAGIWDAAGRGLLRWQWSGSLAADSPTVCLGRLSFRPEQAGRYRLRLNLDWGADSLDNEYPIVVRERAGRRAEGTDR